MTRNTNQLATFAGTERDGQSLLNPKEIGQDLDEILERGGNKSSSRKGAERLLRSVQNRRTAAAFYEKSRSRSFGYALKTMRNPAHAEVALSQSWVEFLEGRTDERFFPIALRSNCEDLHRRLSYKARTMRPINTAHEGISPDGGRTMSWGAEEAVRVEGMAEQRDNRNPLEILGGREIAEEAAGTIQNALAGLSLRNREVVVLHYFNGLSREEMAEVLGVSLSAIKRRMSRAMRLLRGMFPVSETSPC